MKIITTSLIAICALLALSLIARIDEFGCEAADIFNDYLKRPKMPQHSRYHRDVRKWLHTLEINPQAEPKLVLTLIRNMIERTSSRASRANYEKLAELADDSVECRAELVDLVVSIYAQLDRSRLESLGKFLDHFAGAKFNRCATNLNSAIEHQPRTEQEIDRFFKLRLQLDQLSSDATLLDAIKSSDRKFQLAFDQCSDLKARFGNMLTVLNLAISFGFHGELNARLLKLNEYSRFCPSELITGDY